MPSNKARKLYESIQSNTSGWTFRTLRQLLLGYGFEETSQKGSHVVFKHPVFEQLRATITDHPGDLPPGYAVSVRKLIQKLIELEAAQEEQDE